MRPIPGHPDYFATSTGAIWSCGARRYMRLRLDRGYFKVTLRHKRYWVHRLVALAFLGLPPEGHVVCHINHDPKDNRAENLMYGTQRENVRQTIVAGRHQHGIRHHSARLRTEDIAVIRARLGTGERGVSLAREYGITAAAISDIKRGVTWR